jgi:serine protease AprX
VQGLRVPSSFIDANNPGGVIDSRYFRGSGTSQATAIAAGAVALLLQKYPSLTPDQVKRFFRDQAKGLSGAEYINGQGELQLGAMLSRVPSDATQSFTSSTGSGSLELSRGSDHIADDGVVLTGEQDIFGHAFDGTTATSWSGGVFNGNSWSGNSWSGNSWSGNSWSGNSWSGNSWSGNSWSGNSWSGNSWSGNSWSGSSWSTGYWG